MLNGQHDATDPCATTIPLPRPQSIMFQVKEEPVDSVILLQEIPTTSGTLTRSPKPQRRSGRIEIVLPTKRQLYGTNPPSFENASRFIKERNLAQPVVKKEEEVMLTLPNIKVEIKQEEVLSEDVVNRRIALVAPYEVSLDPAIRDVTTTRTFTSKRWGGNTQSTFPKIRADMLARHGLKDFMYLNLYFNPHAPRQPGAPGLFFASSVHAEAWEWPETERVLVRLRSNRWLYVGQYRCTPAASLTPEEWKSQAPKVKQTWTTKVSTQGWGTDIRAKIVLRKRLGRDPTLKELDHALESHDKFHATPEEIHRAFDEGHAVIQAWSMTCIGYDEDFQRQIAAGNEQ